MTSSVADLIFAAWRKSSRVNDAKPAKEGRSAFTLRASRPLREIFLFLSQRNSAYSALEFPLMHLDAFAHVDAAAYIVEMASQAFPVPIGGT
jgi:hypothetical protein